MKIELFPLSNFLQQKYFEDNGTGHLPVTLFLNFWPKKIRAYIVACTMYHLHGFKFF